LLSVVAQALLLWFFYVQVRNYFFFSVIPMRVVSRKTKSMRVGLRTRILRLRAPIVAILF
jgi:hypothetical protein